MIKTGTLNWRTYPELEIVQIVEEQPDGRPVLDCVLSDLRLQIRASMCPGCPEAPLFCLQYWAKSDLTPSDFT